MEPLLPQSERQWWYDTTYPQYAEDALIKSRYYNDHRDDPYVLDYIDEEIDPVLNENAYDELVEGTSNVSMDTWVTGTDTGQYNNRFRTGNSVVYLNSKQNVPIREIVQNEIEDGQFMTDLDQTLLSIAPTNGTLRRSPRSNGRAVNGTSPRNGRSDTVLPLSPRRQQSTDLTTPRSRDTISPRSGRGRLINTNGRSAHTVSPRNGRAVSGISPRSNDVTYRGSSPLSPRSNRAVSLLSPGSRSIIDSADTDLIVDTQLVGISPVNMQGRDMSPRRSSWIIHDGTVFSPTLSNAGVGDNIVANLGNNDREYSIPSTSSRYITVDDSVATGAEDIDSILQVINSMSDRMIDRPTRYTTYSNGVPNGLTNGVQNGVNGTVNTDGIGDDTDSEVISNSLYVQDEDGQVDIIYKEVNRSLLNQ